MRSLSLLALAALAGTVPAADPTGNEFFEQKIRPALVQHCYACHSDKAKRPQGGLRVDSRAALLQGGDSGPSLVVGKPHESVLLKAMRGDEYAVMPPKGKLPDAVIADFDKWVRMGAPDPREGTRTVVAGIDLDTGRQFWAFQPLKSTPVPAVRDTAWPRGDLDRFLLAALEAKGLTPVADASKATLLRRLSYDLVGLPPTPAQLTAFERDTAPDAVARVVDALLASPAFGERWGRHWLDVARYADSNGKDENLTFHDAFRYRDYVVASVNHDKPFGQFLREQIAGDLLPGGTPAERDEWLTGTGFLCIGPKVLADRDIEKRRMDVVDEQIDTVGKAFLGLTLGCARCHDHKFDPVPTADYYALAGIFNSTRTLDGFKLGNPIVSGWMVRPLGGTEGEQRQAALKEHQAKLAKLAKEITKAKADAKLADDKAMMRVPTKLVGIVVDDPQAKVEGSWKPSKYTQPYVGEGYLTDERSGKGDKRITWTPTLPATGEYEVQLSYTAGGNRAKAVPITVRHAGGESTVTLDQTKPPTHDGLFASVGNFRFEAGTAGSVMLSNAGTVGFVLADACRFVPTGAFEKDAEMAMGVPAATRKTKADAEAKVKALEAQEAALKKSAPPAPATVLAVRDEVKCEGCKINIRGNPHQLGADVPRGFLRVLPGDSRPAIADKQSGRLELARWLSDPANPLPARVYVNRVWMHLFGQGLVRTVDNFGAQGERPSHPELLDELAARFVAEGGSTKKLVRALVLSRAYSLATATDAALAEADPENRLLGRAHRRRLDAEAIRDGILCVAGTLDTKLGGSAVAAMGERAIDNDSKGGGAGDSSRRSLYLPILRNDVPALLEVFDFADPDVSTGQRDCTTVPTQALVLMNSPFALAQAKAAAGRLLALPTDDAGRLDDLYRRAFGRPATADERDRALAFVSNAKARPKATDATAWAAVCQAVFGCTEFRYLD